MRSAASPPRLRNTIRRAKGDANRPLATRTNARNRRPRFRRIRFARRAMPGARSKPIPSRASRLIDRRSPPRGIKFIATARNLSPVLLAHRDAGRFNRFPCSAAHVKAIQGCTIEDVAKKSTPDKCSRTPAFRRPLDQMAKCGHGPVRVHPGGSSRSRNIEELPAGRGNQGRGFGGFIP